jgi:hypothetical protein
VRRRSAYAVLRATPGRRRAACRSRSGWLAGCRCSDRDGDLVASGGVDGAAQSEVGDAPVTAASIVGASDCHAGDAAGVAPQAGPTTLDLPEPDGPASGSAARSVTWSCVWRRRIRAGGTAGSRGSWSASAIMSGPALSDASSRQLGSGRHPAAWTRSGEPSSARRRRAAGGRLLPRGHGARAA